MTDTSALLHLSQLQRFCPVNPRLTVGQVARSCSPQYRRHQWRGHRWRSSVPPRSARAGAPHNRSRQTGRTGRGTRRAAKEGEGGDLWSRVKEGLCPSRRPPPVLNACMPVVSRLSHLPPVSRQFFPNRLYRRRKRCHASLLRRAWPISVGYTHRLRTKCSHLDSHLTHPSSHRGKTARQRAAQSLSSILCT